MGRVTLVVALLLCACGEQSPSNPSFDESPSGSSGSSDPLDPDSAPFVIATSMVTGAATP